MSLICHYFHVVIRTKNNQMTIPEDHKDDLYRYITGIIKKRNGVLVRINGIGSHIHMLLKFEDIVNLSDVIHDVKLGATHFIKDHRDWYPMFDRWAPEYASFTCSAGDQKGIIHYIDNQIQHHYNITDEDEMKHFCQMAGVQYYPPKE